MDVAHPAGKGVRRTRFLDGDAQLSTLSPVVEAAVGVQSHTSSATADFDHMAQFVAGVVNRNRAFYTEASPAPAIGLRRHAKEFFHSWAWSG